MNYYTVQKRLKHGWNVKRAFEEKSQQEKSFSKLCKEHGINQTTAYSRIKSGWTLDEALNTPTKGRGAGAIDYSRAGKSYCLMCGNLFEKKNGVQKYCCSECRTKAKTEQRNRK